MLKMVGRYNLDFAGKVGSNDEYEMLIVQEFDSLDNEIRRKTFYLRNDIETAMRLLSTESDVDNLMSMKNNTRLTMGDMQKDGFLFRTGKGLRKYD